MAELWSTVQFNVPNPAYSQYSSHDGQAFTTRDRDHDVRDGANCAVSGAGPWWWRDCGHSGLNGQWGAGGARGLLWWTLTGGASATWSLMSVLPS